MAFLNVLPFQKFPKLFPYPYNWRRNIIYFQSVNEDFLHQVHAGLEEIPSIVIKTYASELVPFLTRL